MVSVLQDWIKRVSWRKPPAWLLSVAGLATIILIVLVYRSGNSAGLNETSSPGSTQVADLAWEAFIKMLLILGVLVGALVAVGRWKGGVMQSQARRLSIIETTRLGPKQALHLVRVGERMLLIGATDQGMSALLEVDPAQVEVSSSEGSAMQAMKSPFEQLLANFKNQTRENAAPPPPDSNLPNPTSNAGKNG
jgi:flagellar biogenesis protein FliO